MKKDILKFVTKCPSYRQVNVKHQQQGGLSQDITIPILKWEDVNMDFIVGFYLTEEQYD